MWIVIRFYNTIFKNPPTWIDHKMWIKIFCCLFTPSLPRSQICPPQFPIHDAKLTPCKWDDLRGHPKESMTLCPLDSLFLFLVNSSADSENHRLESRHQGITALYCTLLHFTELHFTALRYCSLYFTELHCTFLHCPVFHWTSPTPLQFRALHCTLIHFTKLHCTFLHSTALHHTLLNFTEPQNTTLHFTEQNYSPLHSEGILIIVIPWTRYYSEVKLW